MITHMEIISSISKLLDKVAGLIDAILSAPVDDKEEDTQRSPPAPADSRMKRYLVVDDSAARIPRPSDLSQPKY